MRGWVGGLALGWALVLAGASLAAVDTAKVADAIKAGDQFVERAKGSEKTGQPPRQAEPPINALLGSVFSTAMFGTGTAQITDSGAIGQLLNNANRVGLVYLLAGTGLTDPGTLASNKAALARADKNVVTFSPEVGRWLDYQIALQGALADATLAFLGSASKETLEQPNVKAGLTQVAGGLAGSLSGMLQTLGTGGLTDGWRGDRLRALDPILPKAAQIVAPSDAVVLQTEANALIPIVKDSAVQAQLRAFAARIVDRRS